MTDSGDLVVLAIHRAGEAPVAGDVRLAPGDVLLLEGRWDALETHLTGTDEVLPVHEPSAIRRQVLPLGPGARTTLVILVAMVAALSSGLAPAAVCGATAAAALVALGVLSPDQAYRSISWSTIVLLGGCCP